jgi:hypothetical protein
MTLGRDVHLWHPFLWKHRAKETFYKLHEGIVFGMQKMLVDGYPTHLADKEKEFINGQGDVFH